LMVSFNSMKNRPERMVRIAQTVGNAGLAATQSMAIQSMDGVTLRRSGRETIRTSAYTTTFRQLNEEGLTTYVELIWPLPGETLQSFAEGIDALCEIGAQHFVVYPLLALPNTEITEQREALGLMLTSGTADDAGEYVYVTGTCEVSEAEYRNGLWLVLSVILLQNTRVLAGTFTLLKGRGIRHSDVFKAFATWAREDTSLSLFERHMRATEGVGHAEWAYWGGIAFQALHAERERFIAAVEAFCRAQPWWDDDVRTVLEIDRLLLPYLFVNTRLVAWKGGDVDVRVDRKRLRADLSKRGHAVLCERLERNVPYTVELNPWNGQLPYFERQPLTEVWDYAYGQLQRVSRFVPQVGEASV
jgi:hypothetical protein